MKIRIGQPRHEEGLENAAKKNPEADMLFFPEGYFSHEKIKRVCDWARITINPNGKNRAFIVNRPGKIILDRKKTPVHEQLYVPSKVEDGPLKMGYLLCREIFQGSEGLDQMNPVRLIFNPIGAGMYSEEQFAGWINEAKRIAVLQKSFVIGTSHSDGFYKNHRCSIPIAYCFDEIGNPIFISKNDTRLRILDTETKSVHVMSGCLKKRSDRLLMRRLLHTWHDGFQILFPDGESEPENPLMGGKLEFENLAGIEIEK